MRFNVWLVMVMALMPATVLFFGLSAADGFHSGVEFVVTIALPTAVVFVGWMAARAHARGEEPSAGH
jgi:hypothetical protein